MAIQNPKLKDLYGRLQLQCGSNCGLLLTEEVFSESVKIGVSRLLAGQTRDTPIRDISFTASIPPGATVVELFPGPNNVQHVRLAGIQMVVDFHIKGQPADLLSTITFDVTGVEARLEIEKERLVARRVRHRVDPLLTTAPNRDAVILALGWDAAEKETFERLESVTLFTMPAVVADQLLGSIAGLPLKQWLKGLRMDDPMTVEPFNHPESGRCVLIRSQSSTSFSRAAECPCSDTTAADVAVVTKGALALDISQQPRVNPPFGFDLDAESSFYRKYAYLYVPEPLIASAFAPAIYPAVTISGGGSFGPAQYSWMGVIAFKAIQASIDVPKASILLETDLRFHLSARAWINLPCDGEQELAAPNLDGDINNVRIRVSFIFDRATQRLVLDSSLENHDVTNLNARLGGIPALAWPLNLILEKVIEHNAPGLITQALRDAVASGRFTLLDFKQLIVEHLGQLANSQGTFADPTGFLVGVGTLG